MSAGEAFEVEAGEAPAAPQRVRRGGRARRQRVPRMLDGSGEGRAGRFLRRSIPVLYFLSFVLTAFTIYATSHEQYGGLVRGQFWEAFRGPDGSFDLPWRMNNLRMATLILLTLAWLTAVLTPAGRGRARWVLVWVAIGATVFSTNREELGALLLWVLIGLAAGCVLYLCRNPQGSRRFAVIVWVLILAELLMPLPFDEEIAGNALADNSTYVALAPEILTAHIEGPQFEYLRSDEPPGRLKQQWDFFVGALPPHLLIFGFILLSLALVGLRGPVLGVVQVIVLVAGLAGTLWVLYDKGTEVGIVGFPKAPEVWSGLFMLGGSLHGRLLCVLPAMAAGLAELGTRDSGREDA